MERQADIVLNVMSEELQAVRNPSSADQNNQTDGPIQLKRLPTRKRGRPLKTVNLKRRSKSSSVESSGCSSEEKASGSDEEWSRVERSKSSEDNDPAWSPGKDLNQRRVTGRATPTKRGRKPKKFGTTGVASIASNLNRNILPTKQAQQSVERASVEEETPEDYTWHFRDYTNGIDPKCYSNATFIMLKSDAKTQARPTLWRVDGKSLLQKYDPIVWKGLQAYRSVSTYTSWNPSKRGLYVPVEVNFLLHGKAETIVSFSMDLVLLPVESSIAKKITEEGNSLSEVMDVYLQTLLSQALDANFLSEIYSEKDDYFLSSLSSIEVGLVRPRLCSIASQITLRPEQQDALDNFPKLGASPTIAPDKVCCLCAAKNPTRKLTLYGQAYNRENLLPKSEIIESQIWILCYTCIDKVLIYHQLFHFRNRIYMECCRKVEKQGKSAVLNCPVILKECIADQHWMSQMRKTAQLFMAEADQFAQHEHE